MKYISVILIAMASLHAQSSATNGVYGGYVGSSRWFDMMRQSAANTAMLRSLGSARSGGRAEVPPDYTEVAGEFSFVRGNPFPGGRLPDLRIVCNNQSADAVERAPFITTSGNGGPSFYTVLKRGQRYDFYWRYYFGGKEQFASFQAPADSPGQIRISILVDPKGQGRITADAQKSYR